MPRRHHPGHASQRQLENQLVEVDALIERKHWIEARDRLEELDRRYPNNAAILSELLNVCYELHDTRTYLDVCERLLKPLQTRKHFNIAEFGYYCNAQMELLMAKHQADGARKWLEMWQGLGPENPLVTDWQRRLSRSNPFQRLLGRV